MKRRRKFLAAMAVVCMLMMFTVALADPGTEGDPLISKSYIDNVLMPKIENLIESKLSGLGSSGNSSAGTAERFTVVNVDKGATVLCDAGTEVILRMGTATVLATEKGGLADTTSGYDIANGSQMPPNHLLIVPVADGRGFKAETDVIVMVKGTYSVK